MTTPDAAGLARALAERGQPCRVEARDRLAVLVPAGAWRSADLATPAERRALHGLATSFGFTHVALELDPAPGATPGAT